MRLLYYSQVFPGMKNYQMVTFPQLNIQLKIFNMFKKEKLASLTNKQAKILLQNQNK